MTDLYLSPLGRQPLKPRPSYRGYNRRHNRLLASLLAGSIALLVIMTPITSWAATGQNQVDANPTPSAQHPREKTYMKRQWGVEVLYVRQTAAGYMLEFRYKVLDADKAQALFERQTKPVLTHEKTGARFIVPTPAKTGALRNSNPPLAGNTYWMFFANPGKFVQPGDTVSIEIGKFMVDNLVVR